MGFFIGSPPLWTMIHTSILFNIVKVDFSFLVFLSRIRLFELFKDCKGHYSWILPYSCRTIQTSQCVFLPDSNLSYTFSFTPLLWTLFFGFTFGVKVNENWVIDSLMNLKWSFNTLPMFVLHYFSFCFCTFKEYAENYVMTFKDQPCDVFSFLFSSVQSFPCPSVDCIILRWAIG